MQFATTLRYCLRWLLGRPILAAGFGAIGGPLAYGIGARMGAVTLGPHEFGLFTLGLLWSVAVLSLASFASREPVAGYRLAGTV